MVLLSLMVYKLPYLKNIEIGAFRELLIMKPLEQKHIDRIRRNFKEIESLEGFIELMNYTYSKSTFAKSRKPFKVSSFNYFANPEYCVKRYTEFTIPKKSGGKRRIHAPYRGLKVYLKTLNTIIQCIYNPAEVAIGFVPGKSIVDNAKKHVRKHYVYNIDLKDFFHSFDRNKVKMGFIYPPFNLGYDNEKLAFKLASLCTHPFELGDEIRTVLPQGSPTSPVITNVLCKFLDHRLKGLAKRFGLTYSRYADDITFSSMHNVYNNSEFQDELKRIIKDQDLTINPKKTRLQRRSQRQEVTGLVVNEKVNVRREYVRELKMWIYYWEKYGKSKAQRIFLKDYLKDNGHIKGETAKIENVIDGKLQFLKMVKGENDSTYLKLMARFNILTEEDDDIRKVLSIWENEGIEAAKRKFYDSKNSSEINGTQDQNHPMSENMNNTMDEDKSLKYEKKEQNKTKDTDFSEIFGKPGLNPDMIYEEEQ